MDNEALALREVNPKVAEQYSKFAQRAFTETELLNYEQITTEENVVKEPLHGRIDILKTAENAWKNFYFGYTLLKKPQDKQEENPPISYQPIIDEEITRKRAEEITDIAIQSAHDLDEMWYGITNPKNVPENQRAIFKLWRETRDARDKIPQRKGLNWGEKLTQEEKELFEAYTRSRAKLLSVLSLGAAQIVDDPSLIPPPENKSSKLGQAFAATVVLLGLATSCMRQNNETYANTPTPITVERESPPKTLEDQENTTEPLDRTSTEEKTIADMEKIDWPVFFTEEMKLVVQNLMNDYSISLEEAITKVTEHYGYGEVNESESIEENLEDIQYRPDLNLQEMQAILKNQKLSIWRNPVIITNRKEIGEEGGIGTTYMPPLVASPSFLIGRFQVKEETTNLLLSNIVNNPSNERDGIQYINFGNYDSETGNPLTPGLTPTEILTNNVLAVFNFNRTLTKEDIQIEFINTLIALTKFSGINDLSTNSKISFNDLIGFRDPNMNYLEKGRQQLPDGTIVEGAYGGNICDAARWFYTIMCISNYNAYLNNFPLPFQITHRDMHMPVLDSNEEINIDSLFGDTYEETTLFDTSKNELIEFKGSNLELYKLLRENPEIAYIPELNPNDKESSKTFVTDAAIGDNTKLEFIRTGDVFVYPIITISPLKAIPSNINDSPTNTNNNISKLGNLLSVQILVVEERLSPELEKEISEYNRKAIELLY